VKPAAADPLERRVAQLDWPSLHAQLHARGYATAGPLLQGGEAAGLVAMYSEDRRFRSRVVMARHGFGRGEYQYFSHPLPDLVRQLRELLYPHLATVANAWSETLGLETRYPGTLAGMLSRCHRAGQKRPTPLLLKYGAGDYNCLHQDLYGEHVFPLQVAFLLSRPRQDFDGGEFVLVEQRPRMQSRPHVVPLQLGEAVIFAVHHRPVQGARGPYRVNLRHGVGTVSRGERFTMGVIFHDAA
jgi:hypothetical protein